MQESLRALSAENTRQGLTEREFLEAVQAHQAKLERIALRYAKGNQAMADDMVQEALLKAWRFRNRFRRDTTNNLKGWLFTLAMNVFKNFVIYEGRPHRGRTEIFDESERGAEDPACLSPGIFPKPPLTDNMAEVLAIDDIVKSRDLLLAVLYRHLSRPVMQALQDCHEGFAHALLLSDFGYSYDEIAEILNIPIGTVCSHINRARAYLKQVLAKIAVEDYGIGLRNAA